MTKIRRDVATRFVVSKQIGPVSIGSDTTTSGAAIDLTNYPGWKVLLVASTGTHTDGVFDVYLEQCATSGGTYATITPIDGSVAQFDDADQTREAAYTPTLPFIRASIDSDVESSGALLAAYVILVPPGS
jgi:hypothetical protein